MLVTKKGINSTSIHGGDKKRCIYQCCCIQESEIICYANETNTEGQEAPQNVEDIEQVQQTVAHLRAAAAACLALVTPELRNVRRKLPQNEYNRKGKNRSSKYRALCLHLILEAVYM